MDDRSAYDNSSPDLRETSSLLSDPLFHLESQRQVSLRHLRRMKRLQAEHSDSELVAAEENERDVHLAKLRLNADLRVLATMIDDLRSASAERRKDWRWSLPVLYVGARLIALLETSAELKQCLPDYNARAPDSLSSFAEERSHYCSTCPVGSADGEKRKCAKDI